MFYKLIKNCNFLNVKETVTVLTQHLELKSWLALLLVCLPCLWHLLRSYGYSDTVALRFAVWTIPTAIHILLKCNQFHTWIQWL